MTLISRNMNYRDVSFKTHQPRTVNDSGKGTMNHFWDANGNLAQVVDCNHNAARLHEWDEENRLRFVLGEKYAGYYGYDADGERVYKLVGTTSLNQVNGGYMDANVLFDACVLYPNPYMVVTKTGYTKHYYAGTERLATVIGGGGLGEIGNPVDRQHSQHDLDIISSFNSRYSDYDPFEHENNLSEPVGTVGIDGTPNPRLDYTCSPIVLTDLDVLTHQNILLEAIEQNAPTMTLVQNVYFYHGDHLGSASWITDAGGNPIQYIHYAPYGELIANQQIIGYDERFKFTGKERDWETGYDYFGARFYDHRKGIWNSVDPLADKYPNVTPYLYCNGNPIMLVDPDGRDWYDADGEIKWTDCKSQEAMNKAGIKGTYLGCAVLDFQGSRYETLGWGNKRPENKAGKDGFGYMNGQGAITASVTLYGPGGENDITQMTGFTMSSDYSTFGAIAEGSYIATRENPGKRGALSSVWQLTGINSETGELYNHGWCPEIDGNLNLSPCAKNSWNYGLPWKDGVYIHSCNASGYAGPTYYDGMKPGSGISVGCLLLLPKDFRILNAKMDKSRINSFYVRVSR